MCRVSKVLPGFPVVQKTLDPTTVTVSVMFSLKIQFVFSNDCFFVCFLYTHKKHIFICLSPSRSEQFIVCSALWSVVKATVITPSQAIRRKWPLRSAANATDQLNLNFIYTVKLNPSIFDAFC